MNDRVCCACGGSGVLETIWCDKCDGTGVVKVNEDRYKPLDEINSDPQKIKAFRVQSRELSLMSAAPELLEALEEVDQMFDDGGDCKSYADMIARIKAAIRKARGSE